MHFTIALLGDSEIALRLPAAIAGSLATVAIFLLGKKLYSKKEAPQYFWLVNAHRPKIYQESLHLKLLSHQTFIKLQAYLYKNLDYQ